MAQEFPIIIKLGGRHIVAAKLQARGHDIGRDAVRMWAARGSIPGDAARLLMLIAEKEEVPYSASDFSLEASAPYRSAATS